MQLLLSYPRFLSAQVLLAFLLFKSLGAVIAFCKINYSMSATIVTDTRIVERTVETLPKVNHAYRFHTYLSLTRTVVDIIFLSVPVSNKSTTMTAAVIKQSEVSTK